LRDLGDFTQRSSQAAEWPALFRTGVNILNFNLIYR
jgi:hypothetical protein